MINVFSKNQTFSVVDQHALSGNINVTSTIPALIFL